MDSSFLNNKKNNPLETIQAYRLGTTLWRVNNVFSFCLSFIWVGKGGWAIFLLLHCYSLQIVFSAQILFKLSFKYSNVTHHNCLWHTWKTILSGIIDIKPVISGYSLKKWHYSTLFCLWDCLATSIHIMQGYWNCPHLGKNLMTIVLCWIQLCLTALQKKGFSHRVLWSWWSLAIHYRKEEEETIDRK